MNYIISSFLVVYGLISIILGIRNYNLSLWMTPQYDWAKSWLGKNHTRVSNILLGILSVIGGLLIFFV